MDSTHWCSQLPLEGADGGPGIEGSCPEPGNGKWQAPAKMVLFGS